MKFHEVELTRQFPFKCSVPFCDFRSRTEGTILKHQRLHQSPKKLLLRCELCPENIYPNWDSIRFHQWMAHARNCHKCSLCNFVARKKPNLVKHVRFHHHHCNKKLEVHGKCVSLRSQMVQVGNETLVRNSNGTASSFRCVKAYGGKLSASRFQPPAMDKRVPVVPLERILVELL